MKEKQIKSIAEQVGMNNTDLISNDILSILGVGSHTQIELYNIKMSGQWSPITRKYLSTLAFEIYNRFPNHYDCSEQNISFNHKTEPYIIDFPEFITDEIYIHFTEGGIYDYIVANYKAALFGLNGYYLVSYNLSDASVKINSFHRVDLDLFNQCTDKMIEFHQCLISGKIPEPFSANDFDNMVTKGTRMAADFDLYEQVVRLSEVEAEIESLIKQKNVLRNNIHIQMGLNEVLIYDNQIIYKK